MAAERAGTEWEALRHAEIMAALHNGPMKRHDGRAFEPRDFMPADPWSPPAPPPGAGDTADLAKIFGLAG